MRHGAGFAGVLVGWRGRETLCLKQLLHLTLDCLGGEGWDFASEVLHGEEQALVLAYSDAYDIQFGIEEVGAMDWGGHPDVVQVGGRLSVAGDVLRDSAEAGACVGAASDEVGFAGILVLKVVGVAKNPAEMIAGGRGQRVIPPQSRQIVLGRA